MDTITRINIMDLDYISPVSLFGAFPLADYMACDGISEICIAITIFNDRQSIFQIECIDVVHEIHH